MGMKTYTIPADIYEALVQYLATKPYAEVGQVMPILLSTKQNEPDEA